MTNIFLHLEKKRTIFWDFDGVIKESVGLKGKAFQELIDNTSQDIKKKNLQHHIQNGGISRYKKIPIYMKWCGINNNSKNERYYLDKYSKSVCSSVINAKWVDGVINILENKKKKQKYIIVTATPQFEIEYIMKELNIEHYFDKIYGSPTDKSVAIKDYLMINKRSASESVLIGDNISDYLAAKPNKIEFILRSASWNKDFSDQYKGIKIKNFL